jgi:hypothetical protein
MELDKKLNSKIKIGRETVENIVEVGEPFSYESLKDKIIDNGGILRFGGNYTFGMYLKKLEERNVLKYNAQSDKFEIIDDALGLKLKINAGLI